MVYSQEHIREEGGVRLFSNDDFYWKVDLPVEKLQALREKLKTVDIYEACRLLNLNPRYFVSLQRSDFMYFLPQENRGDFTILDLGSGFGNITIPLAQRMPNATVYAVDGSLEILKFLKTLADKKNCQNISCAKVGAFEECNLPFKEKSFDLILMNGVLEWIGAGVPTGSPQKHQQRFLSHVRTLLKDGGSLYVGIEGRYFPGYFKNVKDPHSQLLYTSVVPRFFANVLCKLQGKPEGYRTYTYAHSGYRALFADSGFVRDDIETIYPVASYKDPYFLFSYHDHSAYAYAFNRLHKSIFTTKTNNLLYRGLRALRLERFFAPSYLFLASAGDRKGERLLERYLRPLLPKNETRFEPIKVVGNRSDAGYVSFFLIPDGKRMPKYVFKIKRAGSHTSADKVLLENLVRIGSPYFVLPCAMEGPAQLFLFIQGKPYVFDASALKNAVNLLAKVHCSARTGSIDVQGVTTPAGFVHGDFTLDNILNTETGLKIIDFENASFDGPQVFDLFDLLSHYGQHVLKLSSDKLVKYILSKDTKDIISIYDQSLTQEKLHTLLSAYVANKKESFRDKFQDKYRLYTELGDFLMEST